MTTAETRILVIADQESFVTQIQPHLVSLGYLVISFASSIHQAVQTAAEFLPNIMLIDTIETIEWLELSQQLQKFYDTPTIFLVDHANSEFLKQVKLTQPFEYIAKPLDARAIHLTIELIAHKKKLFENEQKLANLLAVSGHSEVAWQEPGELDQAGMAIDHTHLLEAEREQRKLAETLREIGTELSTTLNFNPIIEGLLDQVSRLVPYDSGTIFLIEQNFAQVAQTRGYKKFGIETSNDPAHLSFDLTPIPQMHWLVERKKPLVISDTSIDPDWPKGQAWAHVRSWIGVPIEGQDQFIAFLSLDKTESNFYQPKHAEHLALFASQAAIAIQNAHLYEQAQRHAAELELRVAERTFELEVLYELTQALGQATQLNDVVRLILLYLYRAIPHDVAASLLLTDSTNMLMIQSQRLLSLQVENNIQEIMCTVLNRPLTRALEVRRIQSKTEAVIRPSIEDLASIMQVLIIIDEVPVGLLFVATEQPNQFTQEQRHLLRIVADQAAESIQRLQLLLAAEYQRLENLVAHLPDGIILLNVERRLVLANQAAQRFLSSLTSAATGNPLDFLGNQSIDTILSPNLIGLPQEVESNNYPRQTFEIVAKPMVVGPEAGGWTLVVRDVTAERAVKERVQQQERLAAVGQLAAGIAHDFNNILTSMIGFAELARIDPQVPPAVGEDLQRIIQQGQRAAALIRQVLDFSRQSVTEKRPIEFASVLKETIKLLERTIPEAIQFNLEIEPNSHDAYTFNGDLNQIQQVLANLAINARDAMPTGGMILFRLTSLKVKPGQRPPFPAMSPGLWMALSISDTGVGISSKVLPRIFEPFFTTKEVGQGTGLGLAQVYGIITQHEGYIDVQTEFGKGTTFTIYLPAALPLPQILSPIMESETLRGHGEVILLVEDDPAVLEVTQAMLEHLGYQVITASNGRQALEVYHQYQNKIALVLTDVTMPELGGIALSQNLRIKYPTVKVIALTGYSLESEPDDLLNQGIIDWLQKPLNRHQLAQTISRSLRKEMKQVVRSGG
jgi:signal transduction histidine kinase/DNA-binding response OmpR family regulator